MKSWWYRHSEKEERMKKSLILSGILVSVFLFVYNIHAQESAIDYKQLIAKCSEAIKQAKSYNVKMGNKYSLQLTHKKIRVIPRSCI